MFRVPKIKGIEGKICVSPDKSISHRAIIFSSLVRGKTRIVNFLKARDTLVTLQAFKRLGVDITFQKENTLRVESSGKYFKSEGLRINTGESGTSIRLLAGLLSAQKFPVVLTSSGSLSQRPMRRIVEPLRLMGADIQARRIGGEDFPPLKIRPVKVLKGITYRLPLPSAQVKSCLLLAGLYAQGESKIIEPYRSRDHTERMLRVFRAKISRRNKSVLIRNSCLKTPGEVFIPGDFSSASFFLSLALLVRNSSLVIEKVGINPTRLGFLKVLRRMGADIRLMNRKDDYFEPYADIGVKSSFLKATLIREEEIPLMIDEVPLLFVVASFAQGVTQIYGLRELRVKETDRLYSMAYNLRKVGVDFEIKKYSSKGKNNFMVQIKGPLRLRKKSKEIFKTFSDHRTSMSLIVFSLALNQEYFIDDINCVNKSFPDFLYLLNSVAKK